MKVKLINENCRPYRAYANDSGLDLSANISGGVFIYPGRIATIPSGIAVEIPPGYEGQVRGRSGWTKRGLIVPLGTIDNHYRGEIKVTMCNISNDPIRIEPYDRIAQLVICPVSVMGIEYTEELSVTDRGENGLGSTGVEGGCASAQSIK